MPNGTERVLAEVLAGVVQVDHVPPDSHFFEDLCASSLVMAHFCARVRKRPDLPSVSMRDVYGHPTIRPSDHPQPGRRARSGPRTRRGQGRGAATAAGQYSPLRPVRGPSAAGLRPVLPARRGRHRPRLRVGLRRRRSRRDLWALDGLRRRPLPRRVRPAGGGQVAAGRTVAGDRVPGLEPGVRPFLDRAGTGAGQPDGTVRRQPALRAPSAAARRPHRPGRDDPVPLRARLHRPADDRRRHRDPQGLRLPLLPGTQGPDPDRTGHPRPGRVRRREDRPRHRHLPGRQRPAWPRLRPVRLRHGPRRHRRHGSPAQPTDVDHLRVPRPAAPPRAGPGTRWPRCSRRSCCTSRSRSAALICCSPWRPAWTCC